MRHSDSPTGLNHRFFLAFYLVDGWKELVLAKLGVCFYSENRNIVFFRRGSMAHEQ